MYVVDTTKMEEIVKKITEGQSLKLLVVGTGRDRIFASTCTNTVPSVPAIVTLCRHRL